MSSSGSSEKRTTLWAFSSMLLVIFFAALDTTVVATALPAITSDLGGIDQVGWILSGFLLATAVSIPVWGKLADLIPRRRLYITAATLFVGSSAIIGFAPNMAVLIAGRVLQGLGTGGLMALTPTIVGVLFSAETRSRYQGIMGAVLASASVVGPLVGGPIVDNVGWRWAFLVNLPFGAAAIAVVVARLRLAAEPSGGRRVDTVGAVLVTIGVLSLLLAFGESTIVNTAAKQALLIAASGVAAIAYWAWQRRSRDPIVPLRLLTDRTILGGVLLSLIAGVVMIVITIHQPLAAQAVDGASATAAGLTLLPLTIAVVVSSLAAGSIVTRLGRYKPVLVVGAVLSSSGILLISSTSTGHGSLLAGLGLVAAGTGIGLTMQPAVLAVQHAASDSDLGAATASTSFFRQIGATLAIGILAGILTSRAGDQLRLLEDGEGLTPFQGGVVSDAIRFNLTVTAVVAAVSIGVALAMTDRRLDDRLDTATASDPLPAEPARR